MTANINVRKIYSVAERMVGCEYSLEIIIVSVKPLFFLEMNMLLPKELLKQWMATRSPLKLNTLSFKEWMTATLSVTKADIVLQSKDGCN